MSLKEITELIATVKKYGTIKHYYSARSLRKSQIDRFRKNGIEAQYKQRAKAWFEVDLIRQ